ncbi:Integrin beta-like protein D [Holothuria leucospilota]|uniref:Integrin beta-like protein D n=1 Tax=Holothuria leucospilota TaxID=206669 RepID=A0A9Q1H4F0_HOLLE|nr:Integrin beta-like protein D [Holothuria leucospilota]
MPLLAGTLFKFFLVSYLLEFTYVSGSHFRGAYITWRPASNVPPTDGSFPEVLFSYRVSWRRDIYFCNQQRIDNMIPIRGEGYLLCGNGCSTLVDTFDFICTDFSVDENWTTGVGTSSFTPTSNTFEAFYAGYAWVYFRNGGGGSWNIRTRVDLNPRSDNGLINSSPVTETSPIVPVALDCPAAIQIPVSDPDGDVVRCRYATGFSECASACVVVPGATLDEDHPDIGPRSLKKGRGATWRQFGAPVRIVSRTDTSGSVRIVYAANQRLVYTFDVSSESVTFPDVSSHFKIQLPMPLLAGEKYLVQLDGGVVETIGECSTVNDPKDLPLMIEKPRTTKKFCF